MVKQSCDRRYLGAVRFVDNATNGVLFRPMQIESEELSFFTNRSRLQVIAYAQALKEHLSEFEQPPSEPEAESLEYELFVKDPLGCYLPRTYNLRLPRPSDLEQDNNLFKPIDIPLFPAPSAAISHNWSVIRVAVFYDGLDAQSDRPIAGAMFRIKDESDAFMVSGMSDHRGEALIIVPGIPITNFAVPDEGSVDDDEIENDASDATGDADESDGSASEWLATGSVEHKTTPIRLEVIVAPQRTWPVDPDQLEANRDDWRRSLREENDVESSDDLELQLKTGHSQFIKLYVSVTHGP